MWMLVHARVLATTFTSTMSCELNQAKLNIRLSVAKAFYSRVL